MIRVIIIILSLLIFSTSCETRSEDEYGMLLEKALNVELPKKYEVVQQRDFGGIGKHFEQFELKYSNEDFLMIVNNLEGSLELSNNRAFYYLNKTLDRRRSVSIIFNIKNRSIKYTYSNK